MEIKGITSIRSVPAKDEAVSHLIESIASEEKALSRLLETKAEHIRVFSKQNQGQSSSTAADNMQFNQSVTQFMDTVVMAEWMLLKKLDTVLQLDQEKPKGYSKIRMAGQNGPSRLQEKSRKELRNLEDMQDIYWEDGCIFDDDWK
ncbi:hypothetical protein [Paenibacillus sp. NPDC057934]|uniref:hypothetical protein n=1 Tax=Paenibacillus sp. NPDC057934 TaxID=3346282 RepID=UPI0036DF7ED3